MHQLLDYDDVVLWARDTYLVGTEMPDEWPATASQPCRQTRVVDSGPAGAGRVGT